MCGLVGKCFARGLTLFAIISTCPTVFATDIPTSVGLFMTDFQQARWQLDNYVGHNNAWFGHNVNPPDCFGPDCSVTTKPLSTLTDVVTSMTTHFKPSYIIVKVTSDTQRSMQATSAAGAIFAKAGLDVYGYHTLGSGDGQKQADAVGETFTTWSQLKGLVIMPSDDFYRDFDSGNAADRARGGERLNAYIARLSALKLDGSLEGKTIIYSPEERQAPHRKDVHTSFSTISDAIMPRTWWFKKTPHQANHGQLLAHEGRIRQRWGRQGEPGNEWWENKPLIMFAQTDMMPETWALNAPKSRIHKYVTHVRDKTHDRRPDPSEFRYFHLKGIAVWEFAHMNRAELDQLREVTASW